MVTTNEKIWEENVTTKLDAANMMHDIDHIHHIGSIMILILERQH